MKNKKIVLLLASLALATGASAQAASFHASCDSQKGEVNVTIYEKDYSAPIMVYLTEQGTALDAIGSENADAIKLIAEVNKGANGYNAALKLPEGIASGYYTFTVADYAAKDDNAVVALADRQVTLYVADDDEVTEAIAAINGATSTNIGTQLSTYKDALSIDTSVDFTSSTHKAFMELKGKKTYTTIAEIASDYAKAQAIGGLCDADKAAMGEKLADYAEVLGIELDDDYTNNASNAHELMESYFDAKIIGNGSAESIKKLAKEAVAVATINGSNRADIDAVLVKYETVFDVDLDGKYSKTNKTSFNKALERKNFKSASEVKKAFDAAVKALDKNSGGSGGGGGTSSSIKYEPNAGTNTGDNQSGTTTPAQSGKFKDLSSAEWARKAIEALAEDGIISGYEDGTFGPNNKITRNEFLSILMRAFGLIDENAVYDFTDGDAGAWYAKAVASAKAKGIITGYADGSFGDGAYITREDMATFIYRMGKVAKAEGKSFADSDDVSEYAKEAVDSLVAAGVLNGMEDGTFAPKQVATRAQVAQVICTMLGGEAE